MMLEEKKRYGTAIESAEAACGRIAPLWPLKNFVAVNPYFGLRDLPFWEAHQLLKQIVGTGLCMPLAYYRAQLDSGRISAADIEAAISELGSSWDMAGIERQLARGAEETPRPLELLTDVLGRLEGWDWSGFVVDRVSHFCASYFDEGQALWRQPWRGTSLFAGWLEYAQLDKSPRAVGAAGLADAARGIPAETAAAVQWALCELEVPAAAMDRYLHAVLMSVGGWAAWTRYRRWQAELRGGSDATIMELLAIRLCWEALLYRSFRGENLAREWQAALGRAAGPLRSDSAEEVEVVLHTALEIGYQRRLLRSLGSARAAAAGHGRPTAQAVFCIDVRSEIFRRALEAVSPDVQTLGFAGFFGVFMEFVPFGAAEGRSHLPVLFKPAYRVFEEPAGFDARGLDQLIARRHRSIRIAKAWKAFKTSAVSTFSFVESAGLLSAHKLLSNSMGWSRPAAHPARKGLKAEVHGLLAPRLGNPATVPGWAANGQASGIPAADRPAVAEFMLRNMGLTRDFSRLVLIVGHGSTTVNNPQATGLDCGACGGQTGEASARITMALLNDPLTRRGLADKGIVIPVETHFLAGLHDTTTDEVHLFGTEDAPASHSEEVRRLKLWLSSAGEIARMERASLLGTAELGLAGVTADMNRRTRDWAQVRPEWGLSGNAAFIVAPRARTAGLDLGGRAFLHEYNWREDPGFATLSIIMSAPMVVGNWISMQYYGSMVDNRHFGSGNKTLHNVVGGSIGVLEGNGGDLRVGLALQSLHDGKRWIHEPVRLNVVVEAPQVAIDGVISSHEMVAHLVDNGWLHLFRIADDGSLSRRGADRRWRPVR